jgi:hypothetical protein
MADQDNERVLRRSLRRTILRVQAIELAKSCRGRANMHNDFLFKEMADLLETIAAELGDLGQD